MGEHASCCDGGDKTPGSTATDPVCGMPVEPVTSKHQSIHDGQVFHFCCAGCKAKFEAAPAMYLGVPGSKMASTSCCTAKPAAMAAHDHSHPRHDHAHTVKDPVCGMTVDPHTAKHRAEHDAVPGEDVAPHRPVQHDVRDLDVAVDRARLAHRKRGGGIVVGPHVAGHAAVEVQAAGELDIARDLRGFADQGVDACIGS